MSYTLEDQLEGRPKDVPYGTSGCSMMCLLHESTFTVGDQCHFCKNGLRRSDVDKNLDMKPRARRKLRGSANTHMVVKFPGGEPLARARTTDPEPSHRAAANVPNERIWERITMIRNLVLASPGQCIRWYTNVLAERMPAPELDVPGCRDSLGVPKHDVGFYGVWTTLFAQAEKHGLIMKVNDPLTPTEKLMKRSPYPGENLVHVYEACTAANVQRMETERKNYFERLETQKAVDREVKAAAVAQRRSGKKVAEAEKEDRNPQLAVRPGQRA